MGHNFKRQQPLFLKILIFESRAQAERPGYYNVGEGMNKAKSAIENSLSTNLNFMEMKDIIKQIINDPNNDLGYEYESSKDPNNFDDDVSYYFT